ncbi:MAG: hypothetical protein GWN14_02020, partial [candidate division Zixibacteria bacterium]|nr:hypothetical protein [Gammaproteobacteria bacterium]NIX54734.1 hypothetical protein [candidate division Zixibacteria bacterium]
CTGQFEKAREVLLSFAEFQNQDQFSPYYGRIPNRVMLNDIIYNTTDGTPWFVIACDRYVKYTGDTDFISLMFPVIKTAMEGALKNHVDEYGFLTHGDAETWMDAVGTEGPWSPRGNRAVEIQVLWLEQTRIAIEWAEFLGDDDWAEDWHLLERRLRRNFKRYFWDDQRQRLVDHLNTDNSADRQIRPNALFALSLPQDTLLMPHQEQAVLKEAMNHLVYPWGVSSLSQEDTNFHPYHHYPPFYVPDAAYHNGLVWTWLSGPLLSALISHHPELGFTLLREESRQILENDAIGSYSELLEAWPREGLEKPLISGTVSQAWNLAEFIRNWHQDVLGIRPDLSERRIDVSPGIPHSLKLVKFKARVGADILQGSYSRTDRDWEITLAGKQELPKLTVDFNLPVADQLFAFSVLWEDQRSLNVQLKSGGNKRKVFVNGKPMNDFSSNRNPLMDDLSFVKPKVDVNIPTLQGPSYDLIPPQQATQRHNTLTAI